MAGRKQRAKPPIGSKFGRHYKGAAHWLEIVKSEGRVAYKVKSTLYRSPSAAAKSVTHTEVNGWAFWGIG